MAGDDNKTVSTDDGLQDDNNAKDNTDTTTDEELLATERVVSHNPNDNDLVVAEKEAIADDEFDEPLAVKTDLGVTDEANLPAELWEEGTGADDIEDIGDLGMSVKEFADTNAADDEDTDNPLLAIDQNKTE